MKSSVKKGLSFGLASGVITTLGLIVGLNAGTHSKAVIISGILVIAVADAFSDAMGMHFSEESDQKKKEKHIWTATIVTFFAKFIFASSFMIPVLLFNLQTAIIVSVIYGLVLIGIVSAKIAHLRREKPFKTALQHVGLAIIVLVLSVLAGKLAGMII